MSTYGIGALTAEYTYGLGLVSQVSTAGGAYYYDFNNIGSTVDLTNSAAEVVNSYAYLPFGSVVYSTGGDVNPFTYVGQFGVSSDGSALYDMRIREYQPTLGQFSSVDPLGLAAGTTNFRGYTDNRPITEIDPMGLDSIEGIIDNIGGSQTVSSALTRGAGGFIYQDGLQAGINLGINTVESSVISGILAIGGFPAWVIGATEFGLGAWGPPSIPTTFPGLLGTIYGGVASGQNPYLNLIDTTPPVPPGGPNTGTTATTQSVDSQDPNSSIGPGGYGPQNFIAATTSILPYRINFENDPSATAPAQQVVVTDQLDPNLDWSTFQFTARRWLWRLQLSPSLPAASIIPQRST